MKPMRDFFIQNGWTIVIGLIAVGGVYATFGYEIQDLEASVSSLQSQVQTLDTQQTQIQVELASIDTNIEYIKQALQLNTSAYAR